MIIDPYTMIAELRDQAIATQKCPRCHAIDEKPGSWTFRFPKRALSPEALALQHPLLELLQRPSFGFHKKFREEKQADERRG